MASIRAQQTPTVEQVQANAKDASTFEQLKSVVERLARVVKSNKDKANEAAAEGLSGGPPR